MPDSDIDLLAITTQALERQSEADAAVADAEKIVALLKPLAFPEKDGGP